MTRNELIDKIRKLQNRDFISKKGLEEIRELKKELLNLNKQKADIDYDPLGHGQDMFDKLFRGFK